MTNDKYCCWSRVHLLYSFRSEGCHCVISLKITWQINISQTWVNFTYSTHFEAKANILSFHRKQHDKWLILRLKESSPILLTSNGRLTFCHFLENNMTNDKYCCWSRVHLLYSFRSGGWHSVISSKTTWQMTNPKLEVEFTYSGHFERTVHILSFRRKQHDKWQILLLK
jgi:hypothetical protein